MRLDQSIWNMHKHMSVLTVMIVAFRSNRSIVPFVPSFQPATIVKMSKHRSAGQAQ